VAALGSFLDVAARKEVPGVGLVARLVLHAEEAVACHVLHSEEVVAYRAQRLVALAYRALHSGEAVAYRAPRLEAPGDHAMAEASHTLVVPVGSSEDRVDRHLEASGGRGPFLQEERLGDHFLDC
jgi:hypothetical protein